jgi:creatinine amidohydrolase
MFSGMRLRDANWQAVASYLERDDRAVLPIGSTEQHAGLSLLTDSILAERVAAEAAEPLGVPVLPVIPYGISTYFLGYPGTVSLRVETLLALVRDVLDSLAFTGFRRILIVNGHGGNAPAASLAVQWMKENRGVRVKFHNWWNAPETWAHVQRIDPVGSHASWMENFPWTRLAGFVFPDHAKAAIDRNRLQLLDPAAARELLGDGNFAGLYQRPDTEMLALWATGVAETRAALDGPWG